MIPVARASSRAASAQTISQSRELVENGRGVIVYPEGTLTRDPRPVADARQVRRRAPGDGR